MEIENIDIHHSKSGKFVTTLYGLKSNNPILDVKKCLNVQKSNLYPSRQELRLEQKSRGLRDDEILDDLKIKSGSKLYLKDLGPQIGWSTVFFLEYSGPMFLYMWIYTRPWIFYGNDAAAKPYSQIAHIAAICWVFHYAKRIFETKFVHRFSHATMPIFNLFKNCMYYWGFAAYVAYHVNHPLYTPPSHMQSMSALAVFVMCEIGNGSIHMALRNLRPPGSTKRNIPYATANPFDVLFNFVSCPNYTYELGAWVAFSLMTQCLPAVAFTLCGFYQMAVWAVGKHRSYKKDFKNYPNNRKAIIPFLL